MLRLSTVCLQQPHIKHAGQHLKNSALQLTMNAQLYKMPINSHNATRPSHLTQDAAVT